MLNYSDEFLINKVNDPFLQMGILRFFRLILKKEKTIDKDLQDLLEMVPTETKIKKNTGNAVLHECAVTIMSLNVDAPVKESAMEVISKMLSYENINSK